MRKQTLGIGKFNFVSESQNLGLVDNFVDH